jgi:hypothetical protein
MQDAATQSELHPLHSTGDLPPMNSEPTGPLASKPADQLTETLKGEPPVAGTQSPLQTRGSGSQQHAYLPQRGVYYAVIAGVIAGVLAALLTIVITLVDDRESRDLMPAALSLEHWWGTREPVRNVGSDRETSSLHEARRVAGSKHGYAR